MDSRTLLDHVLFQLTPTRTRCDVVMYGGGVSEKLASGLLQPFLSHLKTAQHQISKGGYSISLTPLTNASHWFTKPTLQRFVRFVSTPEVLERFVTIEKELEQIESSVQSNDIADAEGGSGTLQRSSSSDVINEDNSKVRLQRALVTRKAVLRKEQAMAYARALVTGFDLDSINDLVSFADAFGASRLREACLNFMELCKKKNQDRFWIDEIAAMQASRLELPFLATSGIVLASEENYGNGLSSVKTNGSVDASDSSHGSVDLNHDSGLATQGQVPMPWPNHHPQYTHNFQGSMYQQMPPYQGYMYPGMQFPYFPGNMRWPPNVDDWEAEDRKTKKSSSRNKSSYEKRHKTSVRDNSTEPSDSSSDAESTESIPLKKNGKKSSRKVIIRNINYITSKKDGEKESVSNVTSDGDEFIGEAIKQKVEEALGRQHQSTSHHHKKSHRRNMNDSNDEEDNKGNDTWGAFQNILLQDKDSDAFESEMSSAVNLESEQRRNPRAISSDSFLAVTRETSTEAESHHGSFEAGENLQPSKTKTDSTYEESLFSQRNEASEHRLQPTFSHHSAESLNIKSQNEGDWFISNQQDKSVNSDRTNLRTFDGDYNSCFDESKKSLPVDDSFFIQNRSLADDQSEPILRREMSMAADIVEATQYENGNKNKSNDKPEAFIAHEPDDLYMVLGRDSNTGLRDYEYDPFSTETTEIYAKDKPSSDVKTGPGGKLPGKETKTKISNGTLGRSKTELTSRTKKPTPAGKPSIVRSKNKDEETRRRLEELAIQRQKRIAERSAAASKRLPVKNIPTSGKTEDSKLQPTSQANKKTVFRSSTIERLAAARVGPKAESVQSKAAQPKRPTSKANGSSQKTNAADQKRLGLNTVKPDALQKKENKLKPIPKPAGEALRTNSMDEFKDIKELHSIGSIENNEVNGISQTETKDDNISLHQLNGEDDELPKEAPFLREDVKTMEMSLHPMPESPNIDFSAETVREISVRSENVTWAEKTEIRTSTPPPEEIIPEAVHSRKKWTTDETSPKAAKGFRKLLLFGRKSRNSAVSMA